MEEIKPTVFRQKKPLNQWWKKAKYVGDFLEMIFLSFIFIEGKCAEPRFAELIIIQFLEILKVQHLSLMSPSSCRLNPRQIHVYKQWFLSKQSVSRVSWISGNNWESWNFYLDIIHNKTKKCDLFSHILGYTLKTVVKMKREKKKTTKER